MSLKVVGFRPGDVHISNVRMNWSTIFTGACLTLGLGIFFLMVGNAIGLSVVNTVRTDISGALKFFSWIYMAITFIFSYAVGAYFCSRPQVTDSPSSGLVHGLTSWALATVVFVGIAAISSIGMRILLAGLASNAANWLAVCIVGIGAVASAVSGYVAHTSARMMGPSDRARDQRVA
ncbi:MAG: hypothetical protein ACJ763_10245 [Bdellovibrionia bacterium]